MRRAVRILAMALLALAVGRPAAARDLWFGRDKVLHFSVCLSVAFAGSGIAVKATDDVWLGMAAGGGAALAVGAGKELWDLHGHGDASWRDFTWDVIGSAVGVGFLLLVNRLALPPAQSEAKPGLDSKPLFPSAPAPGSPSPGSQPPL